MRRSWRDPRPLRGFSYQAEDEQGEQEEVGAPGGLHARGSARAVLRRFLICSQRWQPEALSAAVAPSHQSHLPSLHRPHRPKGPFEPTAIGEVASAASAAREKVKYTTWGVSEWG